MRHGLTVIILGVVLIIIGLIASIGILVTIGIILAAVGAVLAVVGRTRQIGGRSHWYLSPACHRHGDGVRPAAPVVNKTTVRGATRVAVLRHSPQSGVVAAIDRLVHARRVGAAGPAGRSGAAVRPRVICVEDLDGWITGRSPISVTL